MTLLQLWDIQYKGNAKDDNSSKEILSSQVSGRPFYEKTILVLFDLPVKAPLAIK
eukprot:CAMPEP_0117894448 /NCGR_PEP_ID=MMETSP0950-20121206/25962_1 /TAXON_ID=44440 /ORGANISM="Chattonella subsalsa, Strain CCMP2191" /LENGTH=54 /DNA_ID=CAMNT_0005754969 /DNA_START=99 /DNA_END=263 /DNA_ORIENTATION=+